MEAYEPRLATFLSALRAEEDKLGGAGSASRLSERMQESWDKRNWLVNYASRQSWSFDFVWWKFLDQRFYGPNENEDCEARADALTEPQRTVMDGFVKYRLGRGNDDPETWLARVLV